MKKLLEKFKHVRLGFMAEISKFPDEQCEKKLFDGWSLKDVLSHITAWDLWTVDVLEDFKNGSKPYWPESIDEFNKSSVDEAKDKGWSVVYEDFMEGSALLVETYKNFPGNLFDKKIWPNRGCTPRKQLLDDIKHYEKDHLPEVLKVRNG